MTSIGEVKNQITKTLDDGQSALEALADSERHFDQARGMFSSIVVGSNNQYSDAAEADLAIAEDMQSIVRLIGSALASTKIFQADL